MDKEKIKNWVSFPLPEDCQDICILFDRETAMRYVEKFGATPLYGFENNKERWLPVEVFITYGGQTVPVQKHKGVQECSQDVHADIPTKVYSHFGLDLSKMKAERNEHDWGICRKEEAEKRTGNMAGFGMGQSQRIIIDYDKDYGWVLVRRIEKDVPYPLNTGQIEKGGADGR